jgi:hypothetical protein
MGSGILFAIAIGALAVAVAVGLLRRPRTASEALPTKGPIRPRNGRKARRRACCHRPSTQVLYLLRPRFLSKVEGVVYMLLKAAFPRHEIFARVRLSDVLQVKIGPQGMERLRAFRKIANQHVGFVLCDRDMTILAIIDTREPDVVVNPRDQKLETIKQRCLLAAQVKYICIYPPQLPRYRDLREQVLGPEEMPSG